MSCGVASAPLIVKKQATSTLLVTIPGGPSHLEIPMRVKREIMKKRHRPATNAFDEFQCCLGRLQVYFFGLVGIGQLHNS